MYKTGLEIRDAKDRKEEIKAMKKCEDRVKRITRGSSGKLEVESEEDCVD